MILNWSIGILRNNNLKNINTNRELQVMLLSLEKRWDRISSIKDARKRYKEILRLRGEIKMLLEESRKMKVSANFQSKDRGFSGKIFRVISSWLSNMEKKHKDV